jgi:Transposase DDE domain
MNQPIDRFLTQLYIVVDDWMLTRGNALLGRLPGAGPRFSHSEVLTLVIACHWLGYKSQRDFLRFIRNNHLSLFPNLLTQSQFNRRQRNLCWVLEQMRRDMAGRMNMTASDYLVVDGTPVCVRHWRRHGKNHLILEGAGLGYCASKREYFYGYRLLFLVDPEGVPLTWCLIGGNEDEREGLMKMLEDYEDLTVLGDKGFVDAERRRQLREHHNIALLTPSRRNQVCRNQEVKAGWASWMGRLRRLVETSFAQAKETMRLDRIRVRDRWGAVSQVIAKVAALTLAAFFNRQQGQPPLRLAEFAF